MVLLTKYAIYIRTQSSSLPGPHGAAAGGPHGAGAPSQAPRRVALNLYIGFDSDRFYVNDCNYDCALL